MQQPANSDIDILLNAELNTLSSLSSSILEDVDCRLVKFRKGL